MTDDWRAFMARGWTRKHWWSVNWYAKPWWLRPLIAVVLGFTTGMVAVLLIDQLPDGLQPWAWGLAAAVGIAFMAQTYWALVKSQRGFEASLANLVKVFAETEDEH